MSTFHELEAGDRFASPARLLDAETVAGLVSLGGYAHPLFTDPAYAAASPFGRTPVPGQALLLVMGGLVEQTNRFDDTTIALAGFDSVHFRAPAFAGDSVRVEVEVAGKESRATRGTVLFWWRCLNERDDVLVEALARMLFRLD